MIATSKVAQINGPRLLAERPPWITVALGYYRSKDLFCRMLSNAGHQIGSNAVSVVYNSIFTLLTLPVSIDLYEGTVREVTGKNKATTREIWEALDRLGFAECPDETALAVRLAYKDQLVNEWYAVVSKPIADSGGSLRVLSVRCYDDGSWVSARYAHPDHVWNGAHRLLFRRK